MLLRCFVASLMKSELSNKKQKNTFCIFEKCFYGIKNFDPQEKCCTFAMDLKIQASLGCARDSKIKYLDSPLAGTSLASVKR